MNYLDQGFNNFLSRDIPSTNQQELDSLQSDLYTQEISGSKINGGIFSSINKNLKIDLEKGEIGFNNGTRTNLFLGKLSDGTFGIKFNNIDGNETGSINENGLTILDGKINIKNNIGNEIINNQGIVASNFITGKTLYLTAPVTITGDNQFFNLNDFTLNFNTKTFHMGLFTVNLVFYLGTLQSDPIIRFMFDGIVDPESKKTNPSSRSAEYNDFQTGGGWIRTTLTAIFTFLPGDHNIRIECAASTPDSTVRVEDDNNGLSSFTYALFGY